MMQIKQPRYLFYLTTLLLFFSNGCGVYSFRDVSIPPEVKTVRVNFIENRAPYINPQLSQNLTEALKRKIVNQTRLSQSNKDEVDWDISGYISDFSVSTSGISQQRESMNRLSVSVNITLNDRLKNAEKQYTVSRSFEFAATISFQTAQAQLLDQIVRDVSDDIFNRLFSEW